MVGHVDHIPRMHCLGDYCAIWCYTDMLSTVLRIVCIFETLQPTRTPALIIIVDHSITLNIILFPLEVSIWGEGGGVLQQMSVVGFCTQKINWTQSDLRFCENEGSKRSKINDKEGQLDRKSRRKVLQNT